MTNGESRAVERLEELARIAAGVSQAEPALHRVVLHCYEDGWVLQDFDWTAWNAAAAFAAQPTLVESADAETLAKLLTLHIRQDRFVEGHLQEVAASGFFTAVARRAAEIARDIRDNGTERLLRRKHSQPVERDGLRQAFGIPEAERAIYIDFEGNQDQPPSFAGILVGDDFEQVVLEEDLHAAAAQANAKPHKAPAGYARILCDTAGLQPRLRASDLVGLSRQLVARAELEQRLIVAWSRREYDVMRAAVPDMEPQLAVLMRDGKVSAKKWLRKMHPKVLFQVTPGAGKHRLKAYLPLIGYRLPTHFGERQAAPRISFVRQQLRRHGRDFDALTPTAKAKWTKVLDYNWHDCYGLRELMLHVTQYAAAGEHDDAKSLRPPQV